MTTISLEELGKRAAELLEHNEPVMVMRDGEEVAVLYPLRNPNDVPLEVRRKRFMELTEKIGGHIPPEVTDEDIERDFAEFKKHRR
jgi:antitoxin (DNA-binding transcriptional repressor) of toxin-antitoxin stability system